MNAIINTKLIMEDGIIWDGAITFDDGKIVDVGKSESVDISSAEKIYDAGGLYTAPGLIDMHNHGCTECDFASDPQKSSEFFLKHGITTVLPTFYHSISKEDMIKGAERIRAAAKTGAGKIMRGLYMEGPFMNLAGSMQNLIKWSGAIQKEDYVDLINSFGDMVLVWAIDPNRENVEEFMKYANVHTPQAVFAHGHSNASFESIQRLKKYGVKIRTHITNAGRAPSRCQSRNGAGGDEFCYYDPDMYAELICDKEGIHVPPAQVKTVIRIKGVERICIISDHTTVMGKERYKNNEEKGIFFGPDLNYDDEGMLSGSLMTLDDGVRNIMTHTGYGLCHAIRMATLNPARAVGIDSEVGTLEAGKTANFIITDDTMKIKSVFLEGTLAVENGEILI